MTEQTRSLSSSAEIALCILGFLLPILGAVAVIGLLITDKAKSAGKVALASFAGWAVACTLIAALIGGGV